MKYTNTISNIERLSRQCYYVAMGLGIIFIAAVAFVNIFSIDIFNIFPLCSLYKNTGLYCPGCGGTRATVALLKGQLFKSVCYHPAVIYTFVVYIAYVMSHTLNILTRGKTKAMLFRPIYFYIFIVLLLVQCIAKNIGVIFFSWSL